jgi:hypothetical protein
VIWWYFLAKNTSDEAGNTIDRDMSYKINNHNDYSPTNKSLFCLLKLLTSDLSFEVQLGNRTSQDEIRALRYRS